MDTTDERRVRNQAKQQGYLVSKLRRPVFVGPGTVYFLVDADSGCIAQLEGTQFGLSLDGIEAVLDGLQVG